MTTAHPIHHARSAHPHRPARAARPTRWPALAAGSAVLIVLGLRLAALRADFAENRVLSHAAAPPPPPGLPYADLHDDALLWNRNLLSRHARGHADLPRLRAGGVGLQVFSIVTQSPYGINIRANRADAWDLVTALFVAQGRPVATWFSRRARALDRARQLEDAAELSKGRLVVARTREGLGAALAAPPETRPIAGVLSIEGGAPLEGDPGNVRALFDAGVRMISFSHFVDTDLGGYAHGEARGGLTPLGRAVLAEMSKYGIILDLAHASPALIDDALKEWKGPLMVSHTGVRGTCDNQRNLSDDQLRALSARGALIGIGFWSVATCGDDADAIARAAAHAVKVAGPRAVALGSDFDGAVTAPFDATGFPLIAAALARQGLSADEVSLVMGGNARRFMLEHLPSATFLR